MKGKKEKRGDGPLQSVGSRSIDDTRESVVKEPS